MKEESAPINPKPEDELTDKLVESKLKEAVQKFFIESEEQLQFPEEWFQILKEPK